MSRGRTDGAALYLVIIIIHGVVWLIHAFCDSNHERTRMQQEEKNIRSKITY